MEPRGRRLIDEIFEAHARLRAVGREQGTGSDAYHVGLDELRRLRAAHDEEQTIRRGR